MYYPGILAQDGVGYEALIIVSCIICGVSQVLQNKVVLDIRYVRWHVKTVTQTRSSCLTITCHIVGEVFS